MKQSYRPTSGNSLVMQSMNRSMVLQLIYKHPGATRSYLAKHIGLTEAAISKLVNDLVVMDVVEETGYVVGNMGRRAIGLQIKTSEQRVLAIKVSRLDIKIGLFDLAGTLHHIESLRTEEGLLSTSLLQRVRTKMHQYLEEYPLIQAIGIAVPGPLDIVAERILLITEMKDYHDVDLSVLTNEGIDVPVLLTHDANAGAMSEWLANEESFVENGTMAYYLTGAGVGAGIISGGQVLLGGRGMAAEIGHISLDIEGEPCSCGNRGCLETMCSSIAIVRQAKLLMERFPQSLLHTYEKLTATDILREAQNGDPLAMRLTKKAGRAIGFGALNIINAYDPDEIIIGDEMSLGGDLILREVRAVVDERIAHRQAHKVTIRLEDPTYDHILHGAACVAIDHCLKNPLVLSRVERRGENQR